MELCVACCFCCSSLLFFHLSRLWICRHALSWLCLHFVQWNETHYLNVKDPQLDLLTIKIKDKSLLKSALIGTWLSLRERLVGGWVWCVKGDVMESTKAKNFITGTADIPIRDLMTGAPRDLWVNLTPGSAGSIHLMLQYNPSGTHSFLFSFLSLSLSPSTSPSPFGNDSHACECWLP